MTMLDRQKGNIVIQCDGCDDVIETNQADFGVAMNMLRRAGWRARKSDGEWKHYCTECPIEN
jgi:hypothetical protein